ncbi:Poly(rC)-binding protein 4 [Podila verticillata]|nr:Poly(rC)-binding protein 4 [Podila verticillata]
MSSPPTTQIHDSNNSNSNPSPSRTSSRGPRMKMDISILFEDAGGVIGAGAGRLEQIRIETNCTINQISSRNVNDVVFRISGRRNDVLEAVRRMRQREDTGSLSWRYPSQHRWKLIGNRGGIVRRIQNAFGCTVGITLEEGSSGQLLVTCTGSPASQEGVLRFYDRLIARTNSTDEEENEEDEEDLGGLTSISLFAPSFLFGKIIGAGGAPLAEIRETTGAAVEIEPGSRGSAMREILLVGHFQQLSQAKFLIDQRICDATYLQIVLKVFSNCMNSLQYSWNEETRQSLVEIIDILHEDVKELLCSSPDLEVQDQASNVCVVLDIIAKNAPRTLLKITNSILFSPTMPKPPALLGSLYPLIFNQELSPLVPKAQKKVPVLEGLDLEAWIHGPIPEPEPESLDDDDF